MLALINAGLGNLGSVRSAIKTIGIPFNEVTHFGDSFSPNEFTSFLLPGVGSYQYGIRQIKQKGIDRVVSCLVDCGTRGVGICLGMQLLLDYGTEGTEKCDGLRLIPGYSQKLDESDCRVPHIGWSHTQFYENPMIPCSSANGDYYYVHSFAPESIPDENILCTFKHGSRKVVSGIIKDNICGVQFHPEKSHDTGISLLSHLLVQK